MLKQGADVNAENIIGTTPLDTAAQYGHLDDGYVQICECLIDYGADVNAKDEYGQISTDPDISDL